MILDYPVILYKMSMLLEAGMTIRGAFSKIAFHYRDQSGREVHYAYEESCLACYKEQGVGMKPQPMKNRSEMRESSLSEIWLTSFSGSEKGFCRTGRASGAGGGNGMEERKSLARKLGEEAGTKLLLPMMLMLILVVVILMVPAVLAF